MQLPEVFFVNPNGLREHPLLAAIPALEEGDPEFQTILASVREVGVEQPGIIDEDNRLMDGRNRARAAARAGREFPVIKRSSREAPEIILATLIARRHLPKGARAYLAAPFFVGAAESGRQRRLANLSGPKPTQLASGAIGKTAPQIAEEMGISDELYRQALRVRELFERTDLKTWHDGPREVKATFRAWFEPKILAGEIGLGAVIQAIAGKESTEGQQKKTRDLPTLIRRGFTDLHNRFEKWENLQPDTRRELTAEIATEATKWPEDVRQKLLAALEKAAAHKPERPGF